MIDTMDISSVDRDMMTSFLTQGQGQSYAPASGQITGILKQMIDTMEASLATATDEENTEIKDLSAEIESKIARIGELGVELVTQKEDLDDTTKSLIEDQAFLKDLAKNCKTKE